MSFIGHRLTDAELASAVAGGRFAPDAKARRASVLGLERILYVCAECGISRLLAKGEYLTCSVCGRSIKLLPSGALECEGAELPFPSLERWYEYQEDFIRDIPLSDHKDSPAATESVDFFDVTTRQRNLILRRATLSLYSDRMVVAAPNGEEIDFSFDALSDVCLGGIRAVNIYYGAEVYQFKGRDGFCALKYVNLFYKYKSDSRGEKRASYLGVEKE